MILNYVISILHHQLTLIGTIYTILQTFQINVLIRIKRILLISTLIIYKEQEVARHLLSILLQRKPNQNSYIMFYRLATILTGVLLTCLSICSTSATSNDNIHSTNHLITQDTTEVVQTISPQDSIRNLLVQETDRYIDTKFPKSKLTGKALVTACEKYDFDICFALAQGEIESGLGTAGKAKRTNSPWNVGAYDGRSAQTMNKLGYGYSHPDQSIEPYIELVKTKYLGANKTIHDLMNRYTSISGHRYASDPNYERSLRRTYQGICIKTTLRDLQEQLRRAS